MKGLKGFDKTLAKLIKKDEEEIRKIICEKSLLVNLFEKNISEEDYLNMIRDRLNLSFSNLELKELLRDHFTDDGYKETHELIKCLKLTKTPIFLLSDHAEEWIEYILPKYDFFNLFDELFFSFNLRKTKTSKEIFNSVLEKLGLLGEEIIFIDDSASNLEKAKEAGITNLILFTDIYSLRLC